MSVRHERYIKAKWEGEMSPISDESNYNMKNLWITEEGLALPNPEHLSSRLH